ncbi:hypothetical protein ABVT39_015463 [Epinephelus coioides]
MGHDTVPRRRTIGPGQLPLFGKVLRKYQLLRGVRQFGVSYKSMTPEKKKTSLQRISQTVKEFFRSSSRMTTDKTDIITRNMIKHQRMILTDYMLNLHIEFLNRNPTLKLSYPSFCAVQPPKASKRNTCCYHANANLMLQALVSTGG